jgi:O-antigen/teichoic acid export membrane protein
MFYESIFQVALPRLSEYGAQGELAKAKYLWHEIVVSAASLTIPCVIYFQITAPAIIQLLFGPDYLDSVLPYRILLAMLLIQMTGYGLIARAFQATAVYIKANIALLASSIGCGVLLTFSFGIAGAAISAVISFFIHVAIILETERKLLRLTLRALLPFESLIKILAISSAPMLPVYAVLEASRSWPPLSAVLVSAFLYFPPTALLYLRFGLLKVDPQAVKARIRGFRRT